MFEFLPTSGRFGQHQNSRGRGGGIDDTDEGFLGHLFPAHAGNGKSARSDEREDQRETRSEAERLTKKFQGWCRQRGYKDAATVLDREWEQMLTFYNFPKSHWQHIRTSNPVESPFSALRLRTDAARRFKKVDNATAVIWKMLMICQKKFRRLKAPERMKEVYAGVQFVDGVAVNPRTKGVCCPNSFPHLLTEALFILLGMRQLQTEGSGERLSVGYACIESNLPVAAHAIFRVSRSDGSAPSETGIPAVEGEVFRVASVQRDPEIGLDTAMSILNVGDAETHAEFRLADESGQPTSSFGDQERFFLRPGEHRAFFLTQLFTPLVDRKFRGRLVIWSRQPTAVTTLRTIGGLPVSSMAIGNTQD